jgi:hypothetical protein
MSAHDAPGSMNIRVCDTSLSQKCSSIYFLPLAIQKGHYDKFSTFNRRTGMRLPPHARCTGMQHGI